MEPLFVEDNKDIWATLASIANTGRIKHLICSCSTEEEWLKDVDVGDVRKMWEISEKVGFQTPDWFGSRDLLFSMKGGRSTRGSLEENWQSMVAALGLTGQGTNEEEGEQDSFFSCQEEGGEEGVEGEGENMEQE